MYYKNQDLIKQDKKKYPSA